MGRPRKDHTETLKRLALGESIAAIARSQGTSRQNLHKSLKLQGLLDAKRILDAQPVPSDGRSLWVPSVGGVGPAFEHHAGLTAQHTGDHPLDSKRYVDCPACDLRFMRIAAGLWYEGDSK